MLHDNKNCDKHYYCNNLHDSIYCPLTVHKYKACDALIYTVDVCMQTVC